MSGIRRVLDDEEIARLAVVSPSSARDEDSDLDVSEDDEDLEGTDLPPERDDTTDGESDEDGDDSFNDPDFDPANEDDADDEAIQKSIEAFVEEGQKREAGTSRGNTRQKPQKRKTAVTNSDSSTSSKLLKFDEEVILGKNKSFEWKRDPLVSARSKAPSKNVVHITPGPCGEARNAATPIECFNLFINQEMQQMIVTHTNEEIDRQREKFKRKEGTVKPIELMSELQALFGLLILSAATKSNHLSSEYLFDVSIVGHKFRSTMSERRFKFLLNCLRFDDKETRERENKFAPISDLWEALIQNCLSMYKPSSYLTIDEQLVGFRGRCTFLMYIPSKPNKYGLKLVITCDNATKYMINAIPYIGKGTVPAGQKAGEYFVEKLVASVVGTNRNITFDNWFTSVPLISKLLKEKQLTAIGTVKKNKPELPADFVNPNFKKREIGSSLFLYNDDMTAVSYKTKSNKTVTLLSSMHDDDALDAKSAKPEMILCYNQTKGGVDSFDQMCSNMNAGRKTKRWPMAIFYNMINIACINAYVIYLHNFYRNRPQLSCQQANSRKRKMTNAKPLSRMAFMVELSRELCENWWATRFRLPNISRGLREMIASNLGPEAPTESARTLQERGARRYCSRCPSQKHAYTTTYCKKCADPICGKHQIKICETCQ